MPSNTSELQIIRSICYFLPDNAEKGDQHAATKRLEQLQDHLQGAGWQVQTLRLCSRSLRAEQLPTLRADLQTKVLYTWGALQPSDADWAERRQAWLDSGSTPLFFHRPFAHDEQPQASDVDFLLHTLRTNALKLFHFGFAFASPLNSSPYFPVAQYARTGFAVGLQSTNLAAACTTLEQWFDCQRSAWQRLATLLGKESDFLGIDSSVAPLYEGDSSLIYHLRRWFPTQTFAQLATSDVFCRITQCIKTQNPLPVGLCGLMLPCLEDFELAALYEKSEFSTERNLFLSLHSGVGIDTYPIGIDENAERLLQVLRLTHALAYKYQKMLSIRWISDGITRIGERSAFGNPYLQEAVLRSV